MLRYHDVGQGLVDHEGKIRSKKVDPTIARKLLVAAVIEHYLPFSFVEYEWFMGLSKYLNPDIPCISRNTLVSDITKLYLKEKEKLKQVLANIQNRICLTYDVWTAATTQEFICLTGHFVDENWKLNSKILCFVEICPPHLGVELAAKVFGILKEWGIEKKIFSLTLDNTSNFDAHILNTIVQDGLEVVNLALQKIRESVEYVKCFESRVKKFEECEIKAYESQIITNAKKSQLDLYLEEPKLQFSGYEDLDVLEYWKNNMHRYPILALMACDVLAIPITTVISESTFSIGTHVLTKYKDCFPPKKLEAFICIRNWLHGYVIGMFTKY
nr:zinc finger BED domain-containing protein RICESLEEPER 2-like [Ipomoea batatas]